MQAKLVLLMYCSPIILVTLVLQV